MTSKMKINLLDPQFSGDPEAVAMLQAFYSRSIEGIESRVDRLGGNLTSIKKALSRYYVGYGHASIGDCGTVTLFIENVSILAAKAIQEDPRYNGQECSTRYIELTGDGYLSNAHATWWQDQYALIKKALVEGVALEHPYEVDAGLNLANADEKKQADKDYGVWENATNARAFDIARGWIPTNALTNLSLHVTLRVAQEIGITLRAHPLSEVRDIGFEILAKLEAHYPNSIVQAGEKHDAETDWLYSGNYYNTEEIASELSNFKSSDYAVQVEPVITGSVKSFAPLDWLRARPKYAKVPHWVEGTGSFKIEGWMDYGTWRDLQRHRRCVGRPPELRPTGMHPWYLEQVYRYLPTSLATAFIKDANDKFKQQLAEYDLESTRSGSQYRQYHLPLGTLVYYSYKVGLAQAMYLAELRSGNTVHPILRPVAQSLAAVLEGQGVKLFYDKEPARFDLRRGTQTITER